MSTTVTMAAHVELFPLTSVTVNVTLFVPMFAQVNTAGLTLKPAIPQLSVEPLFISPAVIVAFPAPSKKTVRF